MCLTLMESAEKVVRDVGRYRNAKLFGKEEWSRAEQIS